MQGNRISDREAKRREKKERTEQSDDHIAQRTHEMAKEERLALLDLTLPSEIFCNKSASESGKSPPHTKIGIT